MFHFRSHILWWIAACCLVVFIFFQLPTSPSSPDPIDLEEHIEYEDTTQMTDYALLDRLLSPEGTSSDLDAGTASPWKPNHDTQLRYQSLSRQLTMHPSTVQGHTYTELKQLANNVPLVDTPSITVLIRGDEDSDRVEAQVRSVLSQSIVPEQIWVTTRHKNTLQNRFKNQNINIMERSDDQSWIHLLQFVNTDYVWILQDAVPERQYLEWILRLSLTDEYGDALIGTETARLRNQTHTINVRQAMQQDELNQMSQAVDMVNDAWLLRRSWISTIISANARQPRSLPRALTGYMISHTLYYEASVPCIGLPVPSEDKTVDSAQPIEASKQQILAVNAALQDPIHRFAYQSRVDAAMASALFVIDGVEQQKQIVPLLCQFQNKHANVHAVVTGVHRGLSGTDFSAFLRDESPACNVSIHDLRIDFGREAGLPADETWTSSNQVLHRLQRLINWVQPRVMIHVQQQTDPILASIINAGTITQTVTIGLPARDVAHVMWMADLPLVSLEQWHKMTVKLMVTTDRKPHSLARLLRSAVSAHYLGDTVDLSIIMEQSTDRVTQTFANSVPWPHGQKNLRHRIVKVHPMPLFAEAWYPATNDEYAVILNDQLELSELFYVWIKYTLLRYRYAPAPRPAETNYMFGVSLYAPRLMENDPSGRQLFDAASLMEAYQYNRSSPYLMQTPSSSGALFFPEHWREFHDYITARLADQAKKQLQNVTVPNARSSQWTNAWRRYFDELVYMRAYVMLYPNYGFSFSTNHLELGNHVIDDYAQAAALYRVPLMKADVMASLPAVENLPVLDLWGRVTSMDTLKDRGLELQREVSACPPRSLDEHVYDPSDLLCPFAQLVPVTVLSEDEIVPDLPTKVVTIYVTHTPNA
ncbi:uncharacterized protein BYT42DRAFT_615674 [Radiomyces spectabilis]|uniref:uncharacterized protein n=1 Tax=Radiomyces spectabilis TaxID=64574 RepID=UPI002220026A|nr:uncharacterized protein BYT42DRAFT_615674 [Radiomyces spectabilis]KAI8374517.1 hypothetical protein BYT42DRAFT_615674 [Radiomyces spectabilis]